MNLNPGEFAELLRQVRVGGDEDGPSLRVADYLEECGDHDRAGLIRRMVDLPKITDDQNAEYLFQEQACFDGMVRVLRTQVKEPTRSGFSGKMKRTAVGTPVFDISWFCVRNRSHITLDWKRGLIEAVEADGPTWAALAETLTDNHPVRSVTLSSLPQVQSFYDEKHRRVTFACGSRRIEFDRRDLDRYRNMPSDMYAIRLMWPEIEFAFDAPTELDSIQSALNMGVPIPMAHVRHALGLPDPADYGFYGDPTE